MANSVGLHEAEERLRAETIDKHRALTSMMEELEAVDWYDQRVDAATDRRAEGDPRPQPRRGEGALRR